MHRHFLEAQPGRQLHAFTERQHLAGAERGHERQQVSGGIRDRGAQQRLVAIVGEAHRKQRVALGNDGGVELRGALRDEAEINAVFAAFLGDTRDRPAGRPEPDLAVGGDVAVSLFADEQQRRDAVAPRSEDHTSELQSPYELVCRLLLEKEKNEKKQHPTQKKKTKQHTTNYINNNN